MSNLIENPYSVWEHFNDTTDLFDEEDSFYAEIKFPKRREDGFCAVIKKTSGKSSFLQTGYFIGVDRFPGRDQCIYVQPKLNKNTGGEKKELVEVDYLKMLFESIRSPELAENLEELYIVKWDENEIELESKDDFLTPFLIVQFLGVLKSIVKKGLKKSYYRVKQNLNNRIKGKVLVGQTIKRNHFRQNFLSNVCSYEEFGVNGIENRLLKKTLEFVKPYLHSHSGLMKGNKGFEDLLNFINPAFSLVSSNFDFSELKKVKKNPFYKEYITAIDLAEKILRRFGYNIANSSKKELKTTPPFWIDMSKLFELYVLGLLRKEYGNVVQFQFQAKYNELDYILKNEEYKMVIDAKYKLKYENSYHIEDIRQISGYARLEKVRKELELKTEEEVPDCLIIFPNVNLKIEDFKFDNLKKEPIPGFHNIFKLKVPIPLQE
ncbi:5-methylcytosine restriction system specificity protein McrC [Gillisia sp. Q332]|uniref:5-methylcytosine restriction system specificity protein McrC n=1 Tax=Gillisia xinjiangensis TaxID=3384765 RepID=UPI00391DA44C